MATQNIALIYRTFGNPEHVLNLETLPLQPLIDDQVRVKMALAPINPSDVIPITDAYSHRTSLPRISGYEGVGTIVDAADNARHLIGKRVLPLRGEGTWQHFVTCHSSLIIEVPATIPDEIAARAYINPLAAYLMLTLWPVSGKEIMVTAAGSCCARIIAQWALTLGAQKVVGVTESSVHHEQLRDMGIVPMRADDRNLRASARRCDIVFDAVGGPLADTLLSSVQASSQFISYGLLSGVPISQWDGNARPQRFHIREHLPPREDTATWQDWFAEIWARLPQTKQPTIKPYPVEQWRAALQQFNERGRTSKPALWFKSSTDR